MCGIFICLYLNPFPQVSGGLEANSLHSRDETLISGSGGAEQRLFTKISFVCCNQCRGYLLDRCKVPDLVSSNLELAYSGQKSSKRSSKTLWGKQTTCSCLRQKVWLDTRSLEGKAGESFFEILGIEEYPCRTGNLESHACALHRMQAQNRPEKTAFSPMADL